MTALAGYLEAIAVLGPGLPDWPATSAVLAGRAPYGARATELPAPLALPAPERRRVGRTVKLALATGLEAARQAGRDPADLVTVFASSGGDGDTCHEICQALAEDDRQLSPTRFHNSVHNAPAGYWSIATGAMCASTSLCAHDGSFAAGLLEALAELVVAGRPVLLIAYDADYPMPLREYRPIPDAFGVALLLAPVRGERAMARIGAALGDARIEPLGDAGLEALRAQIPAARSLGLLERIARCVPGPVTLEYLPGTPLRITVEPC